MPFGRRRWRPKRQPPTRNFHARQRRQFHARQRRRSFARRYFGFLAIAGLITGGAAAHLIWHEIASSTSGAFVSSQASTPARFSAGYVHVVDGDTLRYDGGRIRLAGIDAPELSQTCRDAQRREWSCGRAARARLIALVSHGQVACIPQGRDRYGRTLATCSAGQVADLSEALVRDGYAVDYRRYTDQYLNAERKARDAGRGIWRGTFERPEVWRHRRSG